MNRLFRRKEEGDAVWKLSSGRFGGLFILNDQEIQDRHSQLPGWDLVNVNGIRQLRRTYHFHDFQQALAFTNRVGQIAEQHNHHPTLLTTWGEVTVTWWTHSAKGLSPADFDLASETDGTYQKPV
jgi:4a-hydroxytetrahydrobiopterin dehydratase